MRLLYLFSALLTINRGEDCDHNYLAADTTGQMSAVKIIPIAIRGKIIDRKSPSTKLIFLLKNRGKENNDVANQSVQRRCSSRVLKPNLK